MKYNFEILRTTRRNILAVVENLSLDELNKVPATFNNNIIWNMAHLVVTQQLLCYRLAGLDCLVEDELIDRFRKGTKSEGFIGEEEVARIKNLLLDLVERSERDYEQGIFTSFKTYTTSYNMTLTSPEEAITFNNTHEGLHFGYILALKKAINLGLK